MTSIVLAIALWVADESVKVRPADAPPAAPQTRIRIAAAGGDCAGAQIVVRGPVQGLRASAAPLRKGVDVQLSRVATITLEHPSGPEGSIGEWPDALVPARDVLFNEQRNAFPVDVLANRSQAIFVEVCAPRGLGALKLEGAVHVSWRGGAKDVPLELRVRGFDLPATPALATAFGFSGYSAADGHGRKDDPAAHVELTRLYDTMALRRGITLFGGTQDAPPYKLDGDEVRIDWAPYDAEVAPYLDGKALPSGARWTAVELRTPLKLNRAQRRSWRRAWVAHFREKGWLDRLFDYVQDEPEEKQLASVEAKAREVREDAPEVRRLVTTAFSDELPSVDLWVPLLNCVGEKNAACPRSEPREKYRKLWWYQSCMSHGCTKGDKPVTHPAFRGWPSYMIDAPATAARAMGVLAYANHVDGELYYDVNYAYDFGDPWKSQWAFGGNGDGTLYYPGTPAAIGGRHDVPVESLRIIQIARAIADYAYLSLCAKLGDPRFAEQEARTLAPSLRGFSRDPRAYAAMRERVASRIEALLAASKRASAD